MSPRTRQVSDVSIVDATVRTIGAVGPQRLTLAQVAAEAGVSPATLLQRFGSKRGLLLAVAKSSAEATGEPFAKARLANSSPLEALLSVCAETARLLATPPEALLNHLAFRQMDLHDPDFHALAAEMARNTRTQLKRLLDEAVLAGELQRCDTARLSRAVQSMLVGALTSWAIERDGQAAKRVRADLESLLAQLRLDGETRGQR